MIDEAVKSPTKIVGDIQENKVGINSENIDFISHLLTTNLYSKPLVSFFRETIANALDSNVESGDAKKPILVLFQHQSTIDNLSYISNINKIDIRISIRDYGSGLSHERFELIYKNIGSSTKRESNDFIGMFGIGRFSCLSVSPNVEITSYYNGTKTIYFMYKNGSAINIDKCLESSTNEPNGLEVSLKTNTTIENIKEALYNVQFFDTVVVKSETSIPILQNIVEVFNARKNVSFKNFSFCNEVGKETVAGYIRMGNVLYENPSRNYRFRTERMILTVPMGSVDIVPSREKLQLTKKTEQQLMDSMEAARKELTDYLNNTFEKEDIDLLTYLNERRVIGIYITKTIKDERLKINEEDCLPFLDCELGKIKGLPIPKRFRPFMEYLYLYYRHTNYDIIYKIISPYKERDYNKSFRAVLSGDTNIAIKTTEKLKKLTVKYLKDTIKTTTIILKPHTIGLLIRQITNSFKYYMVHNLRLDASEEFDFDAAFKIIGDNVELHKIDDSIVPADYNPVTTKIKKGISFRRYSTSGYTMHDINELYKKQLTFLAPNTKDDKELKDLSEMLGTNDRYDKSDLTMQVATLQKSLYDKLESKRFIKVEDVLSFLKPHPIMRNIVEKSIIEDYFRNLLEKDIRVHCLPVHNEFMKMYSNYNVCKRNDLLKIYIEHYQKMGWVRQWRIDNFKLSEQDIAELKYYEDNRRRSGEIIRRYTILRLKHKNLKIGLK